MRKEHLTNLLDAFVVGVSYTGLLGGKLMAYLVTTEEVRQHFSNKYAHKPTVIRERDPDASLLAVTTSSGLGRSSMYNRLVRPDGKLAFLLIGYTAGTGDFHLTGEIYDDLAVFAGSLDRPSHRHPKWGTGFRNRREAIQNARRGRL